MLSNTNVKDLLADHLTPKVFLAIPHPTLLEPVVRTGDCYLSNLSFLLSDGKTCFRGRS